MLVIHFPGVWGIEKFGNPLLWSVCWYWFRVGYVCHPRGM